MKLFTQSTCFRSLEREVKVSCISKAISTGVALVLILFDDAVRIKLSGIFLLTDVRTRFGSLICSQLRRWASGYAVSRTTATQPTAGAPSATVDRWLKKSRFFPDRLSSLIFAIEPSPSMRGFKIVGRFASLGLVDALATKMRCL